MTDGLAPAPREQGWVRIVLALAAFLLLSHAPGLSAIVPVVDTTLLLLPALAVCFLVGWWAGGSFLLALSWSALTALLYALPGRPGSGAYHDLARSWGLLIAGALGLVCVLGRRRAFIHRALPAIGIAMLLALMLVALGHLDPRRAERVFADEFASRNAATAAALQRWAPGASRLLPQASEWAADKTVAIQSVSAGVAAPLYPALLSLEALAACALAWGLYHRFSRARLGPPLARLREFAFSDQLIWALVAGVTLTALPAFAAVAVVGRNLVVFFGALYALRGFGVIASFIASDRTAPQLASGALAFLLLPISAPLAFGLGVSDTWFDWRRRLRGASSPARSDRPRP
jgi:hypothetical protein